MPDVIQLIADSGATKTEWCLLQRGKTKPINTQGISPYFQSPSEIEELLKQELLPNIKMPPQQIYYYGTGLASTENVGIIKKVLKKLFPGAKVAADHDMMGAARALCGHQKGVACILGTGSNSCFYDGKKIIKNRPGLGYILGDEGSGAYLGKKVLQYFLYETFDEDLQYRFTLKYHTDRATILDHVYKKPLPNRYLAGFALFLAENRGHYMVENIIEDGLNDFFFAHLHKYREVWTSPVSFVGGVAYGFKDVLAELCRTYQFESGKILKNPMEGLIEYHRQ
ncbi:MAG: N-acetylglucosamine kinase [Terrimonas sp.]|nr:N-acetylglucosamine kinase [Terrimonas sp.]